MTATSKNAYFDMLDDIVNNYNNTVIEQLKWNLLMLKIIYVDSMELHSKKEVNNKDPKFKVGDHVRISRYKNIFAKGYIPNMSEEVFVIKKVKSTIPSTYVINDLMVKKLLEHFIKKNCRRLIKKNWE